MALFVVGASVAGGALLVQSVLADVVCADRPRLRGSLSSVGFSPLSRVCHAAVSDREFQPH